MSKYKVFFFIIFSSASLLYFSQFLNRAQVNRFITTTFSKISFMTDNVLRKPTWKSTIKPVSIDKVLTTVPSIDNITGSTSSLRSTIEPGPIKKITWVNVPKWLDKLVWNIDLSSCEVNSCRIEPGKEKADIVIIYMVSYKPTSAVYRPPGQIWVLFGHESPANSYSEMWTEPKWRDQINWTMTYRLDSSFPLPYGYAVHRPESERPNLNEVMSKKRKLVAWVVSNCVYVQSGRKEYVDLLNTHLPQPVDIYGGCGNKPTGADVFQKIDEEYKFYLGFENSLCKDYISEKFLFRQDMNLVIIVRGSGNYSYFYPKNTFIDTRDFNSTQELSDYILYLDKNNTAYLEYLQNKAPYKHGGEETIQNHLCEMCRRIHQPMKPSSYKDIGAWWYNNTCTKAKDLV